jgi:hypothetical protein
VRCHHVWSWFEIYSSSYFWYRNSGPYLEAYTNSRNPPRNSNAQIEASISNSGLIISQILPGQCVNMYGVVAGIWVSESGNRTVHCKWNVPSEDRLFNWPYASLMCRVHNFGPSLLWMSRSELWVTTGREGIRDVAFWSPGVALETTPVEQRDESNIPNSTLKSTDKSELHTFPSYEIFIQALACVWVQRPCS